MVNWLNEMEPWFVSLILFALMLASWFIGFRRSRRFAKKRSVASDGSTHETEPSDSKFGDGCMALFGLLLAFTFSISLSKNDARREMVINDGNSISNFYTCASLLAEPTRSELRKVIRDYGTRRVALVRSVPTNESIEAAIKEFHADHQRMTQLVGEAAAKGTPVVEPLVDSLNALTSSHMARLAAYRDRAPAGIVAILFISALATMFLVGDEQGASTGYHWSATLAFIIVVVLIVWVILEMNQPGGGVFAVSQDPMIRVVAGLE